MAQTHSLDLENGSTQYAYVADHSDFDITGDLTFEAWVNLEALPSSGSHYYAGGKWDFDVAGRSYAFRIRNNGGTMEAGMLTSTNGVAFTTASVSFPFVAGVWYHVVWTKSGTTFTLYVNGKSIGTGTVDATMYSGSASFCAGAILGSLGSVVGAFDGLIKDVRIFNDVRTASEIVSDARTQTVSDANLKGEWNFNNAYTDGSGLGHTLTAVNSPVFSTTIPWTAPTGAQGSTYLETNLVSWWTLNETSGTRNDSKGTNHLTDNNTVLYAVGKKGNAADFESTNTEYLSITDASQSGLDFSGDCSFSMWVNLESKPADTSRFAFLSKFTTSGNWSYMVGYQRDDATSDGLLFNTSSTGSNQAQANIAIADFSLATWYHVVFVKSGSTAYAYVNGVYVGSGTVFSTIYNSSVDFRIGYEYGSATYMDGLIDEVAAYSRALHYGDVLDLYNAGNAITYTSTPSYSAPALELGHFA